MIVRHDIDEGTVETIPVSVGKLVITERDADPPLEEPRVAGHRIIRPKIHSVKSEQHGPRSRLAKEWIGPREKAEKAGRF